MDQAILFVIAASLFSTSHASKNVPPAPVLTLAAIDVQVDETESKRINLYPTGPLATCTDDDLIRVFIQSASPSSPCGIKCFDILPCGVAPSGGNISDYCLFFEPSEGSLRYASAPQYTLTIGCSDDNETTSYQTLTVTVVSNTPPTFDSTNLNVAKTINGLATIPGALIYDASTNDIDGDAVYYKLTTNPNTPYISIGYANSQIRATNDLRFLCQDSVQASVTAKDAYHPAIGPMNIALTINPSNKAPYITNLDKTVSIPENVGVGFPVIVFSVVDLDVYTSIDFHMTSTSDAGMEQYTLQRTSNGATLVTRINPNYERSDTRSVKLYFTIDDGYCQANETYFLIVNINDINEQPTCIPNNVHNIEMYEGSINTDTGLYIQDPDINDVHTFTKVGGSSNLFNVDPNSGSIYSVSDIDIDPGKQYVPFSVITVATDKGGLKATCSVGITIYDANDQAPYFLPNPYVFAATECTPPGSVIGRVTGSDNDSPYNNNNKVYYGGGAGKIAVMALGSVVLTQPCINGETYTGSATISDEGIYPRELQGIPATITMTCGPCPPPTPAPTPTPPNTSSPTTTSSTTTVTTTTTATTTKAVVKSAGDDTMSDLLKWLIPAILGGLTWLALTFFLIYRYCCPCRNIFSGWCKRRPKIPKPPKEPEAPKKPKKQVVKKVTKVIPPPPPPPPPKVLTPPPPPPPPEPEPDPYLFGFWKTTYTEQDVIGNPEIQSKPKAIENMPSNDVVPRGNAPAPPNLRLGNPGIGQHRVNPVKQTAQKL